MLLSTSTLRCSMGGYIRDQGTLIKLTDDCVYKGSPRGAASGMSRCHFFG